jgi:hypothetical protein
VVKISVSLSSRLTDCDRTGPDPIPSRLSLSLTLDLGLTRVPSRLAEQSGPGPLLAKVSGPDLLTGPVPSWRVPTERSRIKFAGIRSVKQRVPSRSCPLPGRCDPSPRCFPLAAGGDLFLPYVKTDPHPQQGQFLITREDSPVTAPPRSRRCPDRTSGTTQPQNRMPNLVSLGVQGACAVNWGSAPSRRAPKPLARSRSFHSATKPRSVQDQFSRNSGSATPQLGAERLTLVSSVPASPCTADSPEGFLL